MTPLDAFPGGADEARAFIESARLFVLGGGPGTTMAKQMSAVFDLALAHLASRAADPAPVADEAAIEKWQRDFSLYVVRECPERPNLLRFGEAAVRLMRARLPDIVVSREEVEAAASLMRAAPRNDETAWLIEWPAANGEPARWWRGQCSNWGTADQAIRFCRKRDAEAGIETLKLVRFHGANMDLVATEHSWPAPSTPEGVRKMALTQPPVEIGAPTAREDDEVLREFLQDYATDDVDPRDALDVLYVLCRRALEAR